MNWAKTLQHDIQSGLFRWRYLAGIILFSIPCIELLRSCLAVGTEATWIDYMTACFKGVSLKSATNRTVELPISWLLIMAGANLISLDYFFGDISREGYQILLRCNSRCGWYLSKCAWNLMSSTLFFLTGVSTVTVFALVTNGRLVLENTPTLLQVLFLGETVLPVSGTTSFLTVIFTPWATICALNMVQMTMLLYIKPIYSFLVCMVLLFSAVYIPTGWCLGNGAMMIRSTAIMGVGLPVWQAWIVIGALMTVSLLIGMVRIRKMDFLTMEV